MTRSRLLILIQRWWRKFLKQKFYTVEYNAYDAKNDRRLDRDIISVFARSEYYAIQKTKKHVRKKLKKDNPHSTIRIETRICYKVPV